MKGAPLNFGKPPHRGLLLGTLGPFWGGKTQKKSANFVLRLRDAYKKYILQKNWVKTALPALSSGQNNLQVPIWGCHRQLDDQCRNPNTNNKDNLVGQLTMFLPRLENHPSHPI